MVADTCVSQIVSWLLRARDAGTAVVRRYRRGVGWLIAVLSYSMELFVLLDASGVKSLFGDASFTAVGVAVEATVVVALAWARLGTRQTSILDAGRDTISLRAPSDRMDRDSA